MLGLFFALNIVSHFFFQRLDFSAGKVYSISPGTKGVLARLKDTVVIRTYFTPHLPPPYGLNEQYLRDLLGEYRAAGRGRVRVEFVDPDENEQRKQEAVQAGLAPVQINTMSRDKFEAKEAFMGIVFLYNGQKAVLPVINDIDSLEYALTRHIKKLSDPKLKTVGFVTGHGELSLSDPSLAQVDQLIREQMEVQTTALDKTLPRALDALWILAPTKKFRPAELDVLKGWVASGKSLGLFMGRRSVAMPGFQTAPLETGLEDLLKGWGLEERDGFVVDAQCERIQVQSQYGMYMTVSIVDYPYMPIIKSLNAENPATRSLDSVTFPFAHPLVFHPESASGARYVSLANSSRESWYQTSTMVGPGLPIERLQSKEEGPFSLAGTLEVGPGRVIVAASQDLLNARLNNKPTSVAFFLNLLDWSFQDQDLLSIRAKGVSIRPLRQLNDTQRLAFKYLMILFLPSALMITAVWLYRRRRSLQGSLPAIYGEEDIPAAQAADLTEPSPHA